MNQSIKRALENPHIKLLVTLGLFLAGFAGAFFLHSGTWTELTAKALIGYVTAGLSVSGLGYCAIVAIWGNNRPHLYSWLIWTIVNAVAWYNQWTHEAGPGAWSTLAMTILSGIVFLIAAYQYVAKISHEKITALDQWCLGGAVLSILFLIFFNTGPLSIIVASITDALAFIPTLKKVWAAPHSETPVNYTLNTIRHTIALFAMQSYNFVTLLFPVSLIVLNALTAGTIIFRKRQRQLVSQDVLPAFTISRAE